jgi:hypothetical protein
VEAFKGLLGSNSNGSGGGSGLMDVLKGLAGAGTGAGAKVK